MKTDGVKQSRRPKAVCASLPDLCRDLKGLASTKEQELECLSLFFFDFCSLFSGWILLVGYAREEGAMEAVMGCQSHSLNETHMQVAETAQ